MAVSKATAERRNARNEKQSADLMAKASKKKATKKKVTKKKKAVTKKKATAKKAAPPPKKKKAGGACAKVREIADKMLDAEPAEVYAACEAAGIHPRTTRAEYSNWCKAKFGKSPSEKFGSVRRGFKKGEGGKAPDDSKVKTITAASAKSKFGWKSSTMMVGQRSVDVITSPDQVAYVRAADKERADLIVDHRAIKGLGKSRWRKLETSGKARVAKKEAKAKVERKAAKRAAPKRKSTPRRKKK